MKLTLLRGRIVRQDRVGDGALLLGDGVILDADFRGNTPEAAEVINVKESYILPAFTEIHAHGGGGHDFLDCTSEAFRGILDLHFAHGVTLLCPTLTACSWDKTMEFLTFCEDMKHHPCFGGVHLEGPFLSPEMSGAQNRACLLAPTDALADQLLEHKAIIRRITVAPELPGAEAFARKMSAAGIALSIGHSAADAETVRRAADWGFSQVTHLYCSTSQRFKRGSYIVGGIVEAALTEDSLTVELIGDGHHVCRESLLMTLCCKGAERVCIVSDAMRAAGCEDSLTESWLGERLPENRVIIEDGVAKLPDRSSFAGSLAAGDTMVAALCGRYRLPLVLISRMMSEVPARLLGLGASRGRIAPGCAADFVILDKQYHTTAVITAGEKVEVSYVR
ncbi:MAG: amidohydrolase family protein [Clostridia bacterium]|nr:amidohydrolase family protein [Clostridia bacterium]